MRAIIQKRFGDPAAVLSMAEVERPSPGEHEILVRVRASSVNPADWLPTIGRPLALRPVFGIARPRYEIPGRDVAGTVEAVGAAVTRFAPGDDVFGELRGGAYADYVVATEDLLARKPGNLGYDEAAAVPLAGVTALQGIRDAGGVRPGHRVLIIGASGGVGTFAVQAAKALDAHVTGVCSTRNLELVRSIGADDVVNYTTQDFSRGSDAYDVIFDLIGNRPLSACRRALRPDGVYVAASGSPGGDLLGPLPYLLRVAASAIRRGPAMKVFAAKSNAEDLDALARLVEAGAVSPIIDRRYELEAVPAALADQGAGHARGKKVITV